MTTALQVRKDYSGDDLRRLARASDDVNGPGVFGQFGVIRG